MQPVFLEAELEAAAESLGENEAAFAMDQAGERMDPGDVVRSIQEAWRSLPPDAKQAIQARGRCFGTCAAFICAASSPH